MFSFSKKRTYLDWASSAPPSKEALSAFLTAQEAFGNPGSPHADGVRAKAALETARKSIAQQAGTKTEAVIFTSGATEANNLAIQGYLHALMQEKKAEDLHVLYLESAHSSTVGVVKELASTGVRIAPIPLDGARIDEQALKKAVTEQTVLVVMEAVCGETGTQFNTRDVRRALDAASPNRRVLLHVDASQLPLAGSFDHTKLGADFIVLDAQKVGGVRGIGALIMPKKVRLTPLSYGGGQQQGIRPGTEVPALASAFACALEHAQKERHVFYEKATMMRTQFLATVRRDIPRIVENGKDQAPHIVSISIPGCDTDYLLMLLDADGFSVSTKSACEADIVGSRAVLAFTKDERLAGSTLRISWGPSTSEGDLRRCAESLIRNIHFIDQK